MLGLKSATTIKQQKYTDDAQRPVDKEATLYRWIKASEALDRNHINFMKKIR